MKRFGAPLRLTWDWDWPRIAHPDSPSRRPSPERVREIGAEIVRAQVLMLEVGYPDPGALHDGELRTALAGFAGSLSLVLSPAAAVAVQAAGSRERLGAETVWLDATPGFGTDPVGLDGWPAVRFFVTSRNLEAVADGIDRALRGGAAALSFPNLPLFGNVLHEAEKATPDPARFAWLAGRVAAALRGRPEVTVHVHHFGFWQSLRAVGVHPHGEEAPGAGCQAAAALGYIDPAGILYPCASLPVPLARLCAGAITESWSGPTVAALREGIRRSPTACANCASEPDCRGGCRGWAHYLAASWDAIGPDCVRPRT